MRKPRAARTLAISAALISTAAVVLPIAYAHAGHGQRRANAEDVGVAVQQAGRQLAHLVRPGAPAHVAPKASTGPMSSGSSGSSGHAASNTTRRHVLFGGTLNLLPEQSKVGHLGIIRKYFTLGQRFASPTIDSAMHRGTTVLLSLDSSVRRGPSYASIAAGKHDAEIRSFLTQVDRTAAHYRIPAVYVDFEHEANSPPHRSLGTPAQFVAAWRHMYNIASRARLNWKEGGRLHWVLVLEHMAYFTRAERGRWSLSMGFAANYFPGSSYVDAVGADGYNSGSCGTAKPRGYLQPGDRMVSPGSMFNPMLTFAQRHGHMPVFIAEWASVRYTNSLVRPRFIHSMQEYVLAHPAIKGVSYWDSWGGGLRGSGSQPGACNMSVNHDSRSLAALAVMNHALQG